MIALFDSKIKSTSANGIHAHPAAPVQDVDAFLLQVQLPALPI
jgi:hypothetical protein